MDLSEWNVNLANVQKILGSEAVIPNDKMSIVSKAIEDSNKFGNAFPAILKDRYNKINAIIRDMEKATLDVRNLASKAKNALGQAEDVLTTSTFDLDPRKPDEKKRIKQAHDLFAKYFQRRGHDMERWKADMADDDKRLEALSDQIDV